MNDKYKQLGKKGWDDHERALAQGGKNNWGAR